MESLRRRGVAKSNECADDVGSYIYSILVLVLALFFVYIYNLFIK